MANLSLYLLGPTRVKLAEEDIEVKPRKALALLIYLAVTAEPHARDFLATLLWPESDQSNARRALRNRLSELNRTLGGEWLEVDRENVGLRAGYWLDVTEFQASLANGAEDPQAIIAAAELYRDDFLTGFTLPDCPEFDEWQFFQSENYRQALATALERLVGLLGGQGEYQEAIQHTRRWLALDPLHEPAQRELMRLYAQSGQRAAALRQYEQGRQLLEEELGVGPSEATQALYDDIQAGRLTDQREEAGPRHNLPVETTTFVGREAELADIKGLLLEEPGCRLLNLVGPGGFGKTRLALATAGRTVDAFRDGAYFVPLASIGQAGHIIPATAESLRLAFYGQMNPKDQLLDYLRPKQLLLVMDNFEHVLGGAGVLSEILSTAPSVTILATSREPLNLQEEWVYDVQGLSFPPVTHQLPGVSEASEVSDATYSAVELFLQRARMSAVGFAPSSDEMADIGRISRLVEGMPLALELAAPWIKVLNCREIAAEIAQSLDFLETTLQNVPERHRSLRAIFEQTWGRLPPPEQGVLMQLSVFRGGCTREAAEQVTGATLPVLSSLMDNALLRRTSTGRYELHELVRQYGAEKLASAGAELEATKVRHAAYYLDFAEETQPYLEEDSQAVWLDRLEREHDNLRAALKWAATKEHAEPGARLAEALSLFWFMRVYLAEGREHLTTFLRLLDEESESQLRARLLDRAGFLARYQGDYDGAYVLINEGLAICRRLGDDHATADALANLGFVVLRQSDLAQARSLYAEALMMHRKLDNGQGIADSLSHLALISSFEGDHDSAQRYAEESLAIWRDLGDRHGIAWAVGNLGMVVFRQGDPAAAYQYFIECVKIAREIDIKWAIALSLEGVARVAVTQNQPDVALHLAGAAVALRETISVPLSDVEADELESDLAPAYQALGEQAAAATLTAGQNQDLEALVQQALALKPEPD